MTTMYAEILSWVSVSVLLSLSHSSGPPPETKSSIQIIYKVSPQVECIHMCLRNTEPFLCISLNGVSSLARYLLEIKRGINGLLC
ncbi:hypothetical protein F4809DRAFT_608147 [Biscogniauxia mediterranea]|nr:hypothetical protein F4809DRAFT_608147 [Biscogniauxia mediterranea]